MQCDLRSLHPATQTKVDSTGLCYRLCRRGLCERELLSNQFQFEMPLISVRRELVPNVSSL